jgi:hypothetical protein
VSGHLPDTLGPVHVILGGRSADGRDDHLSDQINAALGEITQAAVTGAAGLVSAAAAASPPAAVRGVKDVAEQLAEQQVAVLMVAADVSDSDVTGEAYRIGVRPTELLAGDDGDDADGSVEVPLCDGLVWAALHQDAIVVQVPDRSGPLGGEPCAALLRRGVAR